MKGKIFEMNKEKQGKEAKDKSRDNCMGTEQQQQQQQLIDIVASNKSGLEHHLKFESERSKVKDKIKGKGIHFDNRTDTGAKEKEYDKSNGEEKMNSKRKVEEKGKEKGRAKESTDDVSKESDRHTHREMEKEKDRDRDKDKDRLSLAGAVLGRRAPATSGITSKPRLEQVYLALSYLFFSLTILHLSYPLFTFPFFQ